MHTVVLCCVGTIRLAKTLYVMCAASLLRRLCSCASCVVLGRTVRAVRAVRSFIARLTRACACHKHNEPYGLWTVMVADPSKRYLCFISCSKCKKRVTLRSGLRASGFLMSGTRVYEQGDRRGVSPGRTTTPPSPSTSAARVGLLRRGGLATNFGFLFPTVAVQPYAVRGGGHAIAACACGTPRTHGT